MRTLTRGLVHELAIGYLNVVVWRSGEHEELTIEQINGASVQDHGTPQLEARPAHCCVSAWGTSTGSRDSNPGVTVLGVMKGPTELSLLLRC